MPSLGVNSARGISFSSPQKGMVALSSGTGVSGLPFDVLATTSGGRTWQPEVIDGSAGNDASLGLPTVLATKSHDYFADPASQDADQISAVFATGNGGASPRASQLSISIGPRKLTAKALKSKHHNRVTVTGKLKPVTAEGEQVQVSHRSPNGRFWQSTLVNVASSGAFQVTLKASSRPPTSSSPPSAMVCTAARRAPQGCGTTSSPGIVISAIVRLPVAGSLGDRLVMSSLTAVVPTGSKLIVVG